MPSPPPDDDAFCDATNRWTCLRQNNDLDRSRKRDRITKNRIRTTKRPVGGGGGIGAMFLVSFLSNRHFTSGFGTPSFSVTNHAVTRSSTELGIYPMRRDISILNSESGTDANSDDDDLVQNAWTNPEKDYEHSVLKQKGQKKGTLELDRKNKIEDILNAEQDEYLTIEREKRLEMEEKERVRVLDENTKTIAMAKELGVSMSLLDYDLDEDIVEEEEEEREFRNSNVKDGTPGATSETGLSFPDGTEAQESEYRQLPASSKDSSSLSAKNTGITTKKREQGISVGTAGGWSLEVFPGDYVVHRKYGIGRFDGTTIQQTTTTDENANSTSVPVLEITYQDATVHVPIDRAYRLSRYRAYRSTSNAGKPRLSKIRSGDSWSKSKLKVMSSTAVLAQDVLALYAKRETLRRTPYPPQNEKSVQEFTKTFEFQPTPDQFTCFEDVENDMIWRSRPMDRLVCGDVGFGKTEVALRALYRCVMGERQAAFLSPTGVLAAQHMKTVIKRMGHFGVRIELLRGGMGKNTKAGRELRTRISAGEVDVIVGTHALLSHGMEFKDLGLLVVDEEQRFGVKQKERLKLISSGVDVLTLSATPIPRTLQMSLSGIRDTSTIRSAPPMRKPIETYVGQFNHQMVKEAIARELARGGQCYYVLPRISMLEDAAKIIQDLFPDVRLMIAHGRMKKQGAEENVERFAAGEADILLATTVIENGVDIPTVNTIIVQNAQAFGMSTLYQLRGRVGRSSLQAYAYFLHKEDGALTEQSVLRLQAMADFDTLGSGFDVASRDLEIRGAGSLLGTEQSGMAAKVGFDLYMRMLKKSIRQLRGLDLITVPRTNVIMPDDEGRIKEKDMIPADYVEDPEERKQEASAARLAESSMALVELTNSWKEKYGAMPASLQAQLKTLHMHACTRQLGIDLVGLLPNAKNPKQIDCILRSPGLRPRHWAIICSALKNTSPKNLNVIFPERFGVQGKAIRIPGGKKISPKILLNTISANGSAGNSEEDEDWDALDQEEMEAMKQISSAHSIQSLDDIDMNSYPRMVITNVGSSDVKPGQRVDIILKTLLPAAKVVAMKQEENKEKAKVAADLRDKREEIKKRKKKEDVTDKLRNGYYY